MIRTVLACARAWLRSVRVLRGRTAAPFTWRGFNFTESAGPPTRPSYDPLDTIPPRAGEEEERPMPKPTKRKRKPVKRAKAPKGKSRSAKTGRYVTPRFAARHAATTVTEREK